MYKFIYLLLKTRLKAKMPELKEVAMFEDQDSNAFKGGLLCSPGLYIQFKPTPTRSLGQGIQEADVEFDLILLSDSLADQDKKIHQAGKITHFDLADKVHKYVSGYGGWLSDLPEFLALKYTDDDYKVFNTADRTGIDFKHRNKSVLRTVQSFKCYAKDYTGERKFQNATAGIEIEEISFYPS